MKINGLKLYARLDSGVTSNAISRFHFKKMKKVIKADNSSKSEVVMKVFSVLVLLDELEEKAIFVVCSNVPSNVIIARPTLKRVAVVPDF